MAGAPGRAGGPGPSVSAGRRAARIWRTASGSSTVAITRSRPPQRGHAKTSSAKDHLSYCTSCRRVVLATRCGAFARTRGGPHAPTHGVHGLTRVPTDANTVPTRLSGHPRGGRAPRARTRRSLRPSATWNRCRGASTKPRHRRLPPVPGDLADRLPDHAPGRGRDRHVLHPSCCAGPSTLRPRVPDADRDEDDADVTPLHRYSGPVRHPLAFGRFPGSPGYTTNLAPLISQWGEEGFSSCLMRLDHRAVALNPVGASRRASQTGTARVAFAESSTARPPRFGCFGVISRSLTFRPGDSLTILAMASSMGSRVLVSLHPAIQATGRLALATAGLAPARRTCLFWTRADYIRRHPPRLQHALATPLEHLLPRPNGQIRRLIHRLEDDVEADTPAGSA